MNVNVKEKVIKKFESLLIEGKQILQNYGWDGQLWNRPPPQNEYIRWRTEAINLIKRICGEDSKHYRQLNSIFHDDKVKFNSYYFYFCYSIVEAAKRDFDDDFLADIKSLVRADLLDDFLSQAEMLLEEEYHIAAALLAGGVLEDTLRKLCEKQGIPYPNKTSIDSLNISLAKANVYDKLIQKEITAKTDLRNNAAHAHFDKVKNDDVADMIKWIRRFVRDYIK